MLLLCYRRATAVLPRCYCGATALHPLWDQWNGIHSLYPGATRRRAALAARALPAVGALAHHPGPLPAHHRPGALLAARRRAPRPAHAAGPHQKCPRGSLFRVLNIISILDHLPYDLSWCWATERPPILFVIHLKQNRSQKPSN